MGFRTAAGCPNTLVQKENLDLAILAGPAAPSPEPFPVNLTEEGPDEGLPSTTLAAGVHRQMGLH